MKVIIGTPGSGKTKEILRLSALNNIPVLCETPTRVTRLLEKASGYGFRIPSPITKEELNENVKAIYVDDIKILLETMLNVKLEGLVINNDEDTELVNID